MAAVSLKLADGNSIPQIGLGLWQVTDEEVFNQTFKAALEIGYRHFDSAQYYQNEALLGCAIKTSGLPRSDFFITTKIAVTNFGHKRTLRSFGDSLKKLETDYVDLLLLHFPVSLLRKASWRALEEIKATSQAKSIGVSNYTIHHLAEMTKYASETAVVNQVELHVFLQQPELRDYCRRNRIVLEAYSPLAHASQMDNPVIAKIAAKHSVSYAQVMLRWLIEQDLVVIPKSVTPERLKENFDIFGFKLDSEDEEQIRGLDKSLHTTWDPTRVP